MSKRRFTPHERYAVYTVHGEKCYLCSKPLDLASFQVDHVLPESLEGDETRLSGALNLLGLPPSFDLNSYENWMPACGPCNLKKLDTIFAPSLLVQLGLQHAAEGAPKVRDMASRTVGLSAIGKALNCLERASASGQLTARHLSALRPLVATSDANRPPEIVGTPLRLTPLYEVVSEGGGLRMIRGPYGYGSRPSSPNAHWSFDCPHCGSIAGWNGARCVICGQMSDD